MNGEQPQKKKRTWLWVVLGVFIVFVTLAIGGIALTVMFFRQSVAVTDASETTAVDEFAKVRAKFAGQTPLVQMVDGRPQFMGERARPANSTVSLSTMRILAWDDDEAKLVRVAVPFWLLRFKSGPIELSSYAQNWDGHRMSFRIEELEKHGPGLVLDVTEDRQGRVIIWVE